MSAVNAEYFQTAKGAETRRTCRAGTVVDRQRLDANIRQLKTMLPADMGFRIVAKSLPCGPLLAHIATRAETDRLMSFNAAMALQMLELMQGPTSLWASLCRLRLSVACSVHCLRASGRLRRAKFNFWSIPHSASWKCELARRQKLLLRINLKLFGLHCGGIEPGAALGKVLDALVTTSDLKLTGLMG